MTAVPSPRRDRAATRPPRKRLGAMLVIGLIGLGLLVLLAVVAPWIWGDDADRLGPDGHLGSSGEHWLGTDALGRDIFARTLVATRPTLELSALATLIAATVGITLGSLVWVCGPGVRAVGLWVIDVMISYPAVILALVIAAILDPGPKACVIAIGAAAGPAFARLTANLTASVAGRDFVGSARLLGVGPLRLMRRHILPNIAEPLLVLLSVSYAHTLMALSALSFLGLGVQLPDYDWGGMLAVGLQNLYTNPVEAVGPAVAVVLAGLSASFVGDGLAAAAGRSSAPAMKAKVSGAASGAEPEVATGSDPVPALPHRANPATPVRTVEVPDDAVLVIDGLRVLRADGTALVDGVTFHIDAGEIVGVLGESGSGKSLTAMAVARLLPGGLHATARRAALRVPGADELDLMASGSESATTRRRLATEIGIVHQDPSASFNPALKLGGQLTETLRVHMGVSRREAARRAVEQLEFVRITDPPARLRQYPHELSGGMRQRAMIASALLTRPRLVIADEPTTALDVVVRAEVLGLLRAAKERDGTAMLFVSHDIGVVGDLCDRVLVMYAGAARRGAARRESARRTRRTPVHPGAAGGDAAPRRHPVAGGHRRGSGARRHLGPSAATRRAAPGMRVRPALPRRVADLPHHAAPRARSGFRARRRVPPAGSRIRDRGKAAGDHPMSATTPDGPTATRDGSAGSGTPVLTLDGVSVAFGHGPQRKTVLHAVDLTVSRGRTLGLVGESGSGKSTLAKVVVGLVRPVGGRLLLDGTDVTRLRGRAQLFARRRRVQLIAQDPYTSLNPRMTVGETIAEAIDPRRGGATRHRNAVEQRLTQVALGADAATRYPHEFSGGQRQRIAIARALAVEPELIIADEVTSALDCSVQAEVLDILTALRRDLGLTMLFISHDLAVVRHVSDHVAIMRHGRLVEVGAAADVFGAPREPYTRLLLGAASPGAR
ncbi:ATP-binding cassette domain-containing protein [Embleya sp. MST-111070]|uniref:ATP-binding cassette domain-containing protein n=1 Tax=Embleya sp. MST-111070 TaxID=3398231 RepID=UPI003F73979B